VGRRAGMRQRSRLRHRGQAVLRRVMSRGTAFCRRGYSTLAPRCRSASICRRVPPPKRAR
jgi:hypothetical protein